MEPEQGILGPQDGQTPSDTVLAPPVGDGITDDTVAIQAILNAGETVTLESGKTYLISQRLDITKDGTGLVSDGTATLLMSSAAGGFDNIDASAAARYQSNAVGVLAVGVDSPIVEGIHFIYQDGVDGRYVRPMAFRDCDNITVRDNEISHFTKSFNLIHIDDCQGGAISSNYIHDCSTDADGAAQITGIGTDIDSGQFGASGRGSSNLVIENNRIADLAVGENFYAKYGYQTDGINIGFQTSHFTLRHNDISDVGEGLDMFGTDGLVVNNSVEGARYYGLKFVHGASHIVAESNTLVSTGIAAIILAGSTVRDRDTANNIIINNTIEGMHQYDPNLPGSYGIAIRANGGTSFLPRNNLIAGNILHLKGEGQYGLLADSSGNFDNDFIHNFLEGYTIAATRISDGTATVISFPETSPQKYDWVVGTPGDDALHGDASANAIYGGAGEDTLFGSDGDDIFIGRAGSDWIDGGGGLDTAVIVDSRYSFRIIHTGHELFSVIDLSGGNEGTDALYCIERVAFSDGSFQLSDLVKGMTVRGTNLSDTLVPRLAVLGDVGPTFLDDEIHGYGGDDMMNGGLGADNMHGGEGNDTYYVDSSADRTIEHGGEGIDTVASSVDWALSAHTEILILRGWEPVSGTGNGHSNIITGNSADNVLAGLGGVDRLRGCEGDDVLIGGSGRDQLRGGAGSDVFVLDVVNLNSTDTLQDFEKTRDKLAISAADSGFAAGNFDVSAFETGASPSMAHAGLFFDDELRTLYWKDEGPDADLMPIAVFKTAIDLDVTDFLIL